MKDFFEKHKIIVAAAAVIVGICVLGIAGCAIYHVSSDSGKENYKAMTSSEKIINEKNKEKTEKQKKSTEKPADTKRPDDSEVSAEAVEATEEAEIVEDSELDIVETPSPAKETPKPQNDPQNVQSKPEINLSERAQNAQFPFEIHVNKQMNCITVFAMDNNGAYSIPYKAMVCSTGSATPLGTFKTPAKYLWKVLKGNVWGQYSTRISGSILFHSVPYRTSRKDALISKYYNKLGTTASAGCVRLTTIDAKWIYDNCPLGTTVIVYNDSNPGPLGKPTAMKVPEDNDWDPTDPDPANPWRGRILHIDGVSNKTIERGSGFDIMGGISAIDSLGNNVTGNIKVSTNLNTEKTGNYTANYTVSDSTGITASQDCSLVVVDTTAPVLNGVRGIIKGLKRNEVNRDVLLRGISASDNGFGLGLENVEVKIPNLVDGNNTITYIARDFDGNSTSMTSTVVIDITPPVVTKAANAKSIVPLDYQLTDANIKSRIKVTDNTSTSIAYNVKNNEWGYTIDYTVTDEGGNSTNFTDSFNYVDYTFVGEANAVLDENKDFKKGMMLKDSTGKTISLPDSVIVMAWKSGDNVYETELKYVYSSPLGSHTCTFSRTMHME